MADEWKSRGYLETSSAGLMCWRCGALVPALNLADERRPTDLHDEWHRELDER